MPGKKKRISKLVKISARIREEQKNLIDKERENNPEATQDSIIREALDQYFEKGDKSK